jgi:AsmA protein
LDVGSLMVRHLRLGKTHVMVALHGARLGAKIEPIELYGGTGKATLDIDARNAPVFSNTLEFEDIALKPFLSNTIGVKQIEGVGNFRLELVSTGDNPNAIMHHISGKGMIGFHDGHVRGVDLGAVSHTVQSLLGSSPHSDDFTEYKRLSGSFVATNGLLDTKDFRLDGPIVRMTGAGTIDIGNRTIDLRMVPHATTVIAKQKLSIGLPFRVRGPWKHVRYTADLAGLVSGVLDNLESGQAPFKGLFGSQPPKGSKAPKKRHKTLGDALKNMFGIH